MRFDPHPGSGDSVTRPAVHVIQNIPAAGTGAVLAARLTDSPGRPLAGRLTDSPGRPLKPPRRPAYTHRVSTIPAEGWYRDPFAIHEDRWMSQGQPTKLVRDGGTESYDPPPDLPLPATLVPAGSDSGQAGGDSGGAAQESGYSDRRARRAAFDAVTGGALVDEPGGDW